MTIKCPWGCVPPTSQWIQPWSPSNSLMQALLSIWKHKQKGLSILTFYQLKRPPISAATQGKRKQHLIWKQSSFKLLSVIRPPLNVFPNLKKLPSATSCSKPENMAHYTDLWAAPERAESGRASSSDACSERWCGVPLRWQMCKLWVRHSQFLLSQSQGSSSKTWGEELSYSRDRQTFSRKEVSLAGRG